MCLLAQLFESSTSCLLGAERTILVTLSPCGAQAGDLLGGRSQLGAASAAGRVEEVRTLIAARANIEESDWVSDGAGTGAAVFGM